MSGQSSNVREMELPIPGLAPARAAMLTEYLSATPTTCPTCAYSLEGLTADRCPECGLNLQRLNVPCPLCNYNLRGLKSDRCPECGNQLALRIGLAEPRQAPFIAGLIGICLPLGFTSLLLVWVVFMSLFQPGGGPPARDLIPLAVAAPTGGLLLWQWLRNRPRLMRLEMPKRWKWAAVTTAVGLVCPLWFMLTVR